MHPCAYTPSMQWGALAGMISIIEGGYWWWFSLHCDSRMKTDEMKSMSSDMIVSDIFIMITNIHLNENETEIILWWKRKLRKHYLRVFRRYAHQLEFSIVRLILHIFEWNHHLTLSPVHVCKCNVLEQHAMQSRLQTVFCAKNTLIKHVNEIHMTLQFPGFEYKKRSQHEEYSINKIWADSSQNWILYFWPLLHPNSVLRPLRNFIFGNTIPYCYWLCQTQWSSRSGRYANPVTIQISRQYRNTN